MREVIQACEKTVGKPIRSVEKPRRPGYRPPRLVADSSLARRELGFAPEHSTLERIISTAWAWQLKSRG